MTNRCESATTNPARAGRVNAGPKVWPGRPAPLGATWDGAGVNFALYSEHATKVELCLFDSPGAWTESCRVTLPEQTAEVWHGYLPGIGPGQAYGYRVHGPWNPPEGQRFNPRKLLFDPYARAVAREMVWNDALFDRGDQTDSGPYSPLGQVIDPGFDWGADRPPRTPWHETLLYEAHVKGLTRIHPGIPEELRGTYAGLGSPIILDYLRDLGVTAVELLPVHYHIDERALTARGQTNYWGYNTLGFFAPDPRYAASGRSGAVNEFKAMVRALHGAGIELILDVVYNHTAEGDHLGPTLSMRGIDNQSYYRLHRDRSRYVNFSGCGNSLNMRHPHVLQLIMDSLRYWAIEMRVDGFRFDLASALARELWEVDRLGAFFDIIQQDPVLSGLKLIAEPWDLGPDGYQVGNFPPLWTEWNGKYRDCVRRFWRGHPGTIGEMASRLTGSSDLYQPSGRRPSASLNFVTAHDGFTLRDLVSYNGKHNEANGEENRDGENQNESWNCGAEGPTGDAGVNALRGRQQRNLLATLLLSQGVPMIAAGDESGRTQQGNNNAYCQDSPLTWLDWNLDQERRELLKFVRVLTRLRREQPVFRRRRFFQGRPIYGAEIKDIYWANPDGKEMTGEDWHCGSVRCLGVGLVGDQIDETGERGERIVGDTFLILLNTDAACVPFLLGPRDRAVRWITVFDTQDPQVEPRVFEHRTFYPLAARSMAVLRADLSANSAA